MQRLPNWLDLICSFTCCSGTAYFFFSITVFYLAVRPALIIPFLKPDNLYQAYVLDTRLVLTTQESGIHSNMLAGPKTVSQPGVEVAQKY